jgi:cyclopropane fatty-acyl-phospholipid synthase-like methyltransferase
MNVMYLKVQSGSLFQGYFQLPSMKLNEEKNVHMAYIITCAQWCEHLNISTPCAETLDDHKAVSLEKS